MTWIREKIQIPETIKPADRVRLAEVVINVIINRSAAGLDKNNRKFPKYSKDYAERKGVGVDDVDLILSGEMLESIKLLGHKKGEITIGFDKSDDKLNGKAEGNILGSYGGSPNKNKARDFLGIDQGELEILAESNDLLEDLSPEEIRLLAEDLLGDV